VLSSYRKATKASCMDLMGICLRGETNVYLRVLSDPRGRDEALSSLSKDFAHYLSSSRL